MKFFFLIIPFTVLHSLSCGLIQKKHENPKLILFDEAISELFVEKYEDDEIKVEGYFTRIDGQLVHHGFTEWKYPNGKPQFTRFYMRGVQVGTEYEYSTTGKLKVCRFFDPIGQLRYRLEFDDSGRITKEQGERIPQLAFYNRDGIYFVRAFSVDILGFERNIYLKSPKDSIIDSRKLSQYNYEDLVVNNPEEIDSMILIVEYSSKDTTFSDRSIFDSKLFFSN